MGWLLRADDGLAVLVALAAGRDAGGGRARLQDAVAGVVGVLALWRERGRAGGGRAGRARGAAPHLAPAALRLGRQHGAGQRAAREVAGQAAAVGALRFLWTRLYRIRSHACHLWSFDLHHFIDIGIIADVGIIIDLDLVVDLWRVDKIGKWCHVGRRRLNGGVVHRLRCVEGVRVRKARGGVVRVHRCILRGGGVTVGVRCPHVLRCVIVVRRNISLLLWYLVVNTHVGLLLWLLLLLLGRVVAVRRRHVLRDGACQRLLCVVCGGRGRRFDGRARARREDHFA